MEYAEGGLLSANRVYLRLIRERLAFDICAAPFGTRYFFTHRTVYSPAKFGLIQAMVVLMLCAVLIGIFIRLLGFLLGGLAFAAVAVTVGVIFSMAGDKGFPDVDALLLNLPGLGPLYERFFRKETYYRHDTRLMFLDTIPHIVQAEADEITAAKGVKLVREYQTSPILGELYKPVRKGKLVEE